MLDVKQAVKAAINFMVDLYAAQGKELSDIRLEEVERTEDDRYWLITLSFVEPMPTPTGKFSGMAADLLPVTANMRSYKILKVNAESGQVEWMHIRQLAANE